MNFFQKIQAVWQKVSLVQRALLIAVVLTLVIAGGLLTHWARKPDMRVLYQELAPEEAAKITEKISEKGIAYELRNGGTSIYAPSDKIYQLRLDMAKDGLPADSQGGYKLFDNEKIGVSPFVQNINLKRALEEELAKSIQMIDGVVHARIHIVSTKQTLFTSQAGQTSASVILRLKAGLRLNPSNIAAITYLVASGVEGLKAENVTVIDSQGHLLSDQSDQNMANGAGTVQDYKERVEQNLAGKVEDMLTAVLGPGRASVKVNAVIDMTSVNLVTEKYEPKGVPTKEEIKEKTKTEGRPVESKAEGKPVESKGGTEKDSTTVTESVVGKTVETKVDLPGNIKSLTVAALVDLSAADANGTQAKEQGAMIMQLSDVEGIIKNALGLKETDSLKVVHARFHRPLESLVEEEPSKWPRYIAIARQASLGIMAICALLVLRIFGGARKKLASTIPAGQLPGAEGGLGLLPAGLDSSEPLMLRKQIAGVLQNNPEQARQLFSSWLEEKGG